MNGMHLQIKLAVLDVDILLPGRGVNAIVGPSGAGKTTLLRAVAGLESTARGRVEINGDIWQEDAKKIFVAAHQRSVGVVFQEASLFPHLSVQGNLEFGLRRIPAIEQKVSLSQAVKLLGIAPLLNRSPATLSGGEKQRVSIARALATSPKLLLMDEPLSSLDEQRKAEILPYLEQLHNEFDIPLLYVSHATDEIVRLADHVMMLDGGKIRACGSIAEWLTRTDLPFAHGEQASAIIVAKISAYDTHYQLWQADFAGGQLWLSTTLGTSAAVGAIGATVHLRIFARDVSLSQTSPVGSSILNTLPVKVSALQPVQPVSTGLVTVELDANGTKLLTRVTSKSADQLGLCIGMPLFAQIKNVIVVK